MELSKGQSKFLDTVIKGNNVYLSGKAGTGKSHVIRHAINELERLGKQVVAVAPTGIAANNLNGQTIHSMFSINPFGVSTWETVNFMRTEKRRIMDLIDVVFIDEISMLRPDILDAINWTLLKNGCGGINTKQIIFSGDLKQLEPPIDDNTRSVLFQTYDGIEFFNAKCFQSLNIEYIELDEVLRQSDIEFMNALNIVRDGGKSDYFEQFVSKEAKGIVLAPHNATVEKYNSIGLNSLSGPEYTFNAKINGNVKCEDFNFPSSIKVKNGAKIMYLANSNNGVLFNGTLGVFVSHNNCHYIRVDGVDYALNKIEVSKKEYVLSADGSRLELREIGSIEQYPFKLAYALSIHKSQGLTMNEVTIDLTRRCFQKGMLYVALSRVKTPEGLRIITK